MITTTVDLREGYRVEVEPLVLPADKFGARLYSCRRTGNGRKVYKQAGPVVVADTAESAARDLMDAVNAGLLQGVEVSS